MQLHAEARPGGGRVYLLDGAIKVLASALVVAVAGFAVYYSADRQVTPGPGLVDRAIDQAEQMVRSEPANTRARVTLGDLYLDRSRYAEAIQQYTAVLQADPTSWLAHRGLGLAYVAQQHFGPAEQEFQQVVDVRTGGEFAPVDKDLEEAYYFLARAQIAQQRPEAAIPNLETALKIDRIDADAWETLGAAYLAVGRADEAVRALERAVRLTPKARAAFDLLGAAYGAAGNDGGARYAQAMALYAGGDNLGAITALQALTQAQPEFADAWTGLGLAYEGRLQKNEATAAYQRALAANPEDFNARSGLARLGVAR